MKQQKKKWLPKLQVAVVVVFVAQLAGFVLAVRIHQVEESGWFHAAFFIREYESLRERMRGAAIDYVATGDKRYRLEHERCALIHERLMVVRHGPEIDGSGGFSRMVLDGRGESDPLLHAAGIATFDATEFDMVCEITESFGNMLRVEREAIASLAGDGIQAGKLMPEHGGLEDVAYLEEAERFDLMVGQLRDLMMGGSLYAGQERMKFLTHWSAWVIGVGLLQSAVVVFLIGYQRFRFKHLERRAYYDLLTELPNRWYLDMHLDWVCPRAMAQRKVVILAFIDLNGFKPINDALGHESGDYVLKYIADTLKANCRTDDIASRYGGDEFVVVFVAPVHECRQSVDRLKKLIHDTFDDASEMSGGLGFGAAVGISMFPNWSSTPEMLVRSADEAMYRAKNISKQDDRPVVIQEYQSGPILYQESPREDVEHEGVDASVIRGLQ